MTPTRDEIDAAILRGELWKHHNGMPAGAIGSVLELTAMLRALRDQREEVSVVKESLTTVPADVMAALDRMCVPFDDSWLGTASETAKADARCMSLIREYVMALGGDQREADARDAARYRVIREELNDNIEFLCSSDDPEAIDEICDEIIQSAMPAQGEK